MTRAVLSLSFGIVASIHAVPILPVYPEPGEYVEADGLVLMAFLWPAPASGVQVALKIDGQPVSQGVTIEEGLLSWTPGKAWTGRRDAYGRHTAEVTVQEGVAPPVTQSWQFTLLETPPAAVAAQKRGQNGRLFADVKQYGLSGDNSLEFNSGGLYAGFYGKWRYSANLFFTSLEESRSQPRNLYNIQLGYGRIADIKFGDTRPEMGGLLLSGQNVRGLQATTRAFLPNGINLINLDFAYGQTRRAVDPYRRESDSSLVFGAYGRNVMAGRVSFGSGETFQFGLGFLKGKDDTLSIQQARDSAQVVSATDTHFVYRTGDTPKDNLVIGADLVARAWRQRIELFGGYAFSMLTRNIFGGPLTKEDLETIIADPPFDPGSFSDYIIFNTSTTLPVGGTGFLNSSAYQTGLRLRVPSRAFSASGEFKYELLGANYYSMGAPLLGSPRAGFSFSPQVSFLDNRAVVAASFASYENNLDRISANGTRTGHFSLTGSLFYSPAAPGISAGFSNNTASNADTAFGFQNGVNTFNVSTSYAFAAAGLKNSATLFTALTGVSNEWKVNSYSDTGNARIQGADTSVDFATLVYGLNLTAQAAKLPLSFDAGFMQNGGNERFLKITTVRAGARYQVIPERLSGRLGTSFGGSTLPGQSSHSLFKIEYGAKFLPARGHLVGLDGHVLTGVSKPDFVNALNYEYQF